MAGAVVAGTTVVGTVAPAAQPGQAGCTYEAGATVVVVTPQSEQPDEHDEHVSHTGRITTACPQLEHAGA